MARVLKVCISEPAVEVGSLCFDMQGGREFSAFGYAKSWIANPFAFAISPSMPLAGGQYFSKKEDGGLSSMPSALADAVPDSWGRGIIRRCAREAGTDGAPLTEWDYLTSVDDFSRVGALRFRNEGGGELLGVTPLGRYDIPSVSQLNEVGKLVADYERDECVATADLERLRRFAVSLGGARPKCSVVDADKSLLVAKFTSCRDTYDVERAEVMTLLLAKLCGLAVPPARIAMSDGRPVALIARFDRRGEKRIPYVSAMTMLDSASAVGGAYTAIADAIWANSGDPKADLRELFKRVGFTVLVSNMDDHLKNHGFLHASAGKWRLAPLFDVNPAPERHRKLKTSIIEGGGTEASIDLLIESSGFFDVSEDEARSELFAMATVISERWRGLAKECGMNRRSVDIYRAAFEHEEAVRALRLGQPKVALG